MATLTYTDRNGKHQSFKEGDEVFITDIGGRPKNGKMVKFLNGINGGL